MNELLKNPSVDQMQKYFTLYQKRIYPLIAQVCIQPMDGMHGLNTHTAAVVFRGIDFALSLQQDPWPVIFACAFHDMARTHDEDDTEHGKNAVPMAKQIMEKFNLDEQTRQSIIFAVENHTIGKTAPDKISACLWDADRVRVSQVCRYAPEYYNTTRGRMVASSDYKNYLKFQRQCFPNLSWDKIY